MPKKRTVKRKYYDIRELLKYGDKDSSIKYYLVFGERSAGKSTSASMYILEHYWNTGHKAVIVRRYDTDWNNNVGSSYYDLLSNIGYIKQITNGEYDCVAYYARKWYLARYDEEQDKVVKQKEPFCYALALNTWEKTKSAQLGGGTIDTMVLEEYITSGSYLGGGDNVEFNAFFNTVSSVMRDKEDAKIMLLGNTIRRYGNPYHICFGIERGILEMQPGDIRIFKVPDSELRIAVEYTNPNLDENKKPSVLFDVPTDAAKQITEGTWQMTQHYPTLPMGTRIRPMDIIYKYYMIYRDETLEADIVLQDNNYYTYFHRKTTDLEFRDDDVIFDLEYHLQPNFRRDILKPSDKIGMKIAEFFKTDNVYVQSPEIGEILFSYIGSV